VVDSVENLRNEGVANGTPAVLVIVFPQPGANIIDTVDAVKAALPQLEAAMPSDINVSIANDRSTTIRASLQDTETTLIIAVILVTLVVFAFLRNWRATLIPSIAVPVSIIGTFGAMYLLGFSLDILSLMALTVSTGFVVDDAIVVLENISRHLETGMPRVEAALLGAREVGFTVVSISLSLIAVFIPIMLMGGLVGRFFHEFAFTLSLAIMVSLAIALTTIPMLCALFLKPMPKRESRRTSLFDRALAFYRHTLGWALRHGPWVMLVLLITVGLNIWLYIIVPKGFFPEEDTGRIIGGMQADQSTSFQAMQQKLDQMVTIVRKDPAVQSVVGFTGQGSGGAGGQSNTGQVFIALKSISQRGSMDTVMTRLRRALSVVPGARLFLQPVQDFRVGGRQSNAAYQYTLQGDDPTSLYEWANKLQDALQTNKVLSDVNSDQQQKGLQTNLTIDRPTASRLGLTASEIDNTLYDAFGQRQVSTIFSALNQYHVIMEVAPRYWQSPETLKDIYVSTTGGNANGTETSNAVVGTVSPSKGSASTAAATAASIANSSSRNAATNALTTTGNGSASSAPSVSTSKETMIPLAAFTHYAAGNTPLAVNHQGQFVATTISFNLAPGKSLSDAAQVIAQTMTQLRVPASIHGSFQGTAQTFQQSLSTEPLLILTALVAVYIVLGILYESTIHPITILSTLPSAGVGAVLALLIFRTEFSLISLIGVILLIGIVKKNAIMMIDFALEAERSRNLTPRDAIFEASLLRFRPIMMTTFAAMLGAMPLALSFGNGGEIRRPLGIAIVGGLLVSQALTLYTTPVLYLYLDRFRLAMRRRWRRAFPGIAAAAEPAE
jgi:multidrug efflux pump